MQLYGARCCAAWMLLRGVCQYSCAQAGSRRQEQRAAALPGSPWHGTLCCCRTAVSLCMPLPCALQVAIKKVLQDKRFKNRELQIIRMMSHPNIVQLKHCFYTTTEKDEVGGGGGALGAGSKQRPQGALIDRCPCAGSSVLLLCQCRSSLAA